MLVSKPTPMRTVTIRNLRARPLTLNLPAAIVPEASLKLRSGGRPPPLPVARGRAKQLPAPTPKALAPTDRRVSGSITLLAAGTAGSTKRDLPPSVMQAPDVIAARKRGDIYLEVVHKSNGPPVEAPPPEHAKPGKSSTRRHRLPVGKRVEGEAPRVSGNEGVPAAKPRPVTTAKPSVKGG